MSHTAYTHNLPYEGGPMMQPEPRLEQYIRKLRRELFLSWMFISQSGLYEEGREFVQEYEDEPTPFEW